MARLRARIRGSRGASMLEFASTVAVFLLLALGVVETARAIQIYEQITNAAREGTRWAVVHGPNSPSPASSQEVAAYVATKATGLDLSRLTITISWPQDAANPNLTDVVVDVSYPFSFAPSSAGHSQDRLIPTPSFNFSAESRMVIWPVGGSGASLVH